MSDLDTLQSLIDGINDAALIDALVDRAGDSELIDQLVSDSIDTELIDELVTGHRADLEQVALLLVDIADQYRHDAHLQQTLTLLARYITDM